MLEELLCEVILDSTTVPALETIVYLRVRSEMVRSPAEYVCYHPTGTLVSAEALEPVLISNNVRLENLLDTTVTLDMEVDPVVLARNESIVTRVDES